VKIQRTRSAMGGEPFNPTDAAITGFNQAGDPIISGVPNFKTLQTAKIGLDSMIQAQTDAVTGKMTTYGAALVGLKNRLNDQIAAFRPDYATANKLFSDPMRINTAVKTGRDMARRGRPGDTVPAFERLNAPEQQGVRIGWADSVLEPLERTGNFPTMLRAKSPKGQAELEAMSPYGPATLREMLAREETMQRTSRAALGGPQTAENLADMAQAPGGAALGIAGQAVSGNFMGALRGGKDLLSRIASGESEAQRNAIARALLSSEPDAIAAMQRRIAEHELRRRGVNPFVRRAPRYRPGE
jgi:ribosomal protein S9